VADEDAGERPGIKITVEGDLPRRRLEYARRRIVDLARFSRSPPDSVRLTLRVGPPSRTRRKIYVADASVLIAGRLIAAHAVGPTPDAATDVVSERLRRQMRRIFEAEVARRNEPRVVAKTAFGFALEATHGPRVHLKPPEEREIVTVRTVPGEPETTLCAVAELLERDHECEFTLFCHARTGEDVVVFRRDDGGFGLLYPRGSPLSGENDAVIPEPSRYSDPITVADARSEMDVLSYAFLYFIDLDGRRGKVLYLRRDGDYALVQVG
jgi:ribosome-associated translation inhibitor RaiA